MAMFLIVGCQSTQSAETETKLKVVKPEVVKEVKKELPRLRKKSFIHPETTSRPSRTKHV